MSGLDALLLFAAGLAAGVVNAVAGGGTFFTFPALLAVGLPPIAANATSALSLGPGSVASAVAYREEIRKHWRRLGWLSAVSLVGSVAGAWILLRFSNEGFGRLVPWLLLGATLLFAASPVLTPVLRARRGDEGPFRKVAGLALQFVTAVYGGFFGAGMGIVMLASLTLSEGSAYHRINAAKNVLAVLIKVTALVLFVVAGVVHWPEAIVLAVASVIGGYLGVVVARRVPVAWVRAFVVVVGLGLSVRYFIRFG